MRKKSLIDPFVGALLSNLTKRFEFYGDMDSQYSFSISLNSMTDKDFGHFTSCKEIVVKYPNDLK